MNIIVLDIKSSLKTIINNIKSSQYNIPILYTIPQLVTYIKNNTRIDIIMVYIDDLNNIEQKKILDIKNHKMIIFTKDDSKSLKYKLANNIVINLNNNIKDIITAIKSFIIESTGKYIFHSDVMKNIINFVIRIASSEANILITGESGTGKEVIANNIHQLSNRIKEKFIAVNCAAIPDNLLESELFGYEKGAFSGALIRKIGKFEEANNGTILLDEISEMDLRLQAKLLRVIQEKTITRLGSNKEIELNIRIIATSNLDLKKQIMLNKFRSDLFFRLNVLQINIPALRDRKADIPLLTNLFIKKYNNIYNNNQIINNDALDKLNNYHWPGNVRELENIIQRAVILSQNNIITANDIQIDDDFTSEKNDKTLQEVEYETITRTLKNYQNNKNKTAKILDISLKKLNDKLQSYQKEYVLD